VGSYNVYIKTADYRYKISGKSKITIIWPGNGLLCNLDVLKSKF
jgi:hypothetical protein